MAESTRLDDLTQPGQYLHSVTVLADETDALMDTLHVLDEAAVAAPSLCEGWTRGSRAHPHRPQRRRGRPAGALGAARAGDADVRLARGADADIEAGAGRSVADLEADVESSADRLLDALLSMTPGRNSA